ncbi:hypothetical protein Tsubulata_028276 [Turnera subulata]|uniref:6-phosphogluconate dehydrogenase NADP-binding domain-containing protein n=1 Tax=Turnera subulata TaxID=218843 RepID=A0A9Q0J4Q4_9ROSI|nr:hypothetical protein Tsubulata_028276 [Turnera subulata]
MDSIAKANHHSHLPNQIRFHQPIPDHYRPSRHWSNILIPPHLSSRSDVIDHFKRKFYQRYIVRTPSPPLHSTVTVYACSLSKAAALQSQGAHLASSPSEVASRSDVVFTMVGHPSHVRSIVLESQGRGILAGLGPGRVMVDTTTSDPALAREIFGAARAKECWSVDSPVSGGDIGARDGKLAIFAGGDEGVVDWLSPLYGVMGKVTYMGKAGCGQSCKIANQIVVGANLLGLSEGLVFTEKAGLDVRQFMNAVRGGAAGSMALELFGERMIGRDFRPGGFAEYMVKDMDFVEENENERGVPVLSFIYFLKRD